jgi:hypothetical protein
MADTSHFVFFTCDLANFRSSVVVPPVRFRVTFCFHVVALNDSSKHVSLI